MSAVEAKELHEAMTKVAERVESLSTSMSERIDALATAQIETHRATLLMRKSLRSCQSHCHVANSGRWQRLWGAIKDLFRRESLPLVEVDEDIDGQVKALEVKLFPSKAVA